ncbi:free fatty acid receptor 2-like [Alosa sapidissima]|nr:free fatty acid receptor 2-like [Alosa sapidissima]XP_041963160.1 free fatty acid receptor 2-like [Alosa sapidissima]
MHSETHEQIELVLVVYIITFIFGLPANIVALYAFIKKVRRRATPVDVLLIGLTVSDLVFLLFLPLRMKEAIDHDVWKMPDFLCPLLAIVFYGTIYNSSLYLTAISVERYLGVAFPIKYKLNRKPLYAVVGSVIIWTISLAQCSIVYFMHYHHDQNKTCEVEHSSKCYQHFTPEQLDMLLPFRLQQFLLLFCVPLLICCFCYINFIHILSNLPNICQRRRSRAIGLALGTMVVFLVCFGPYNISHLIGYATNESPEWRKIAVLTSTLNTCLDPFIYYFSSSALRGTFGNILNRLTSRLQLHCPSCRMYQRTTPQTAAPEVRTQSTNDNLG